MRTFSKGPIVLFLALSALVSGCIEPLEPEPIEEHPEIGGFAILNESTGEVISRSMGAGEPFDRDLTIGVGEVLEVEIMLISAADNETLFHAHAEDGESIQVRVNYPDIADITLEDGHGVIEGFAPGDVMSSFQLFHGGHSDFDSGTLYIHVE